MVKSSLKTSLSILTLSLLCPVLAQAKMPYEVILPENYQEGRNYPVVYFLEDTEDAEPSMSLKEAGSTAKALVDSFASPKALDTILVRMQPTGADTLYSDIEEVVAEVDASYQTVANPNARAIAGEGLGGYLASMLAFRAEDGSLREEPGLFAMVGAIAPKYQGETSYHEALGDFRSLLTDGGYNNTLARKFYTFIQAPSEEENCYKEGGAGDVISLLIEKGAAFDGYEMYYGNADNTVLELTIPNAQMGEDFLQRAAGQMATGFSRKILSALVSARVKASPRASDITLSEIQCGFDLSLLGDLEDFTKLEELSLPMNYRMVSLDNGEVLWESTELLWKNEKVAQKSEEVAQESEEAAQENEEAAQENEEVTSSGIQVSQENFLSLPNTFQEEKVGVAATLSILGMDWEMEPTTLVRIKSSSQEPEGQFVDLMGEWKFQPRAYVKPGEFPSFENQEDWENVVPCLAWWNEDFSSNTNMKAYTGYAWYYKEFLLPEEYPRETYLLPLGGFDETDLVWVNGSLVGATGMNPETWTHEADCWDTKRVYEIPEELLHFGETNQVLVLTHNQSGDGGWYDGHPCLYSQAAYAALPVKESVAKEEGRILSLTIPSPEKAYVLGGREEVADEHFLVYLPEEYEQTKEEGKRYPSLYLLHQLNSTSNSYLVDHVDDMLDEAIRSGEIPPMIVVIPDSAAQSFWTAGWDRMVTQDILPYVDENFRTIDDRESRYVAGASMGGNGAYHIGLSNPQLFGGIISYFGPVQMASDPLNQAREMDVETLKSFRHYIICGNRDIYKIGIPCIALDHLLRSGEVEHFFELEEGEHDSKFYLPYVIPSLKYITQKE